MPDTQTNPASALARVALVQVSSPLDETPADRIARVAALLRAQPGVDLFVLPELWSPGYFSFEQYAERAESLLGPTVAAMCLVARETGSWVHMGSIIERADTGQLFNTAVLIDPAGEIAQVYRKIHVFGYQSLEAELLTPGAALSVVASPVGPLASTTCYDLRFPGLWQQMSERGAEAAIVPAAWPAARREHWRVLTQARAIEHQIWVLACNASGDQGGVELGGFSRIVDPRGRIIVECGAGEEIVFADLPRDAVRLTRAEFPVIADRLDAQAYARLSADPLSGVASSPTMFL
ncbi:putative amidohydrolase [Leucobacter exalbidus]|uniref:Amidohydrolase n=1 Tax=Leucobacter exalbidus TaxID=662960 RepID=A0A940PUJ6_9MICO|nr:nitrilase-related carbon-nitrogen hydrolase [Leucobacter exalbidus]MBP1327222.1 putative amidohydrolase [Leucobacter exalbidus]